MTVLNEDDAAPLFLRRGFEPTTADMAGLRQIGFPLARRPIGAPADGVGSLSNLRLEASWLIVVHIEATKFDARPNRSNGKDHGRGSVMAVWVGAVPVAAFMGLGRAPPTPISMKASIWLSLGTTAKSLPN